MITYNGNILTVNNKWIYTANLLSEFDFIYLANDFNGDYIPNSADSSFGNYLEHGTLTKNGSGANCYLSNGSSNNYLYKNLTETELDKFKAINSTYTFFFRVYNSYNASGTGGIMSTRNVSGNYNYMIRCGGARLDIHTSTSNYNNDFTINNPDIVYKVQISGNTFTTKNLINGTEWIYNDNTSRQMSDRMLSIYAGYGSEYQLERFYGLAGIPQETSQAIDDYIKEILLNQVIV